MKPIEEYGELVKIETELLHHGDYEGALEVSKAETEIVKNHDSGHDSECDKIYQKIKNKYH